MATTLNPKLIQLIVKWLNKPTFKLEEEPGYEEYREMLLMYRIELQENERIRALQKRILNEAKLQWCRLPGKSPANNPELNLFKNELQVFCNRVIAERDRDKNMGLLNDVRLAFLEMRALFPSKSREEKIQLIHLYKNIDLSIIPEDTPGLDDFKLEVTAWLGQQDP